jgi:UDP-N-acetylglucosamine transferase subunit ALG13
MARFGEAIDDHQLELAEALDSREWVVMVTDLSVKSLAEAIVRAPQRKQDDGHEIRLHSALRTWLAEQAARPAARSWRSFRRKHHRAQ